MIVVVVVVVIIIIIIINLFYRYEKPNCKNCVVPTSSRRRLIGLSANATLSGGHVT